jgi:uncharacterized lipoprotein YddW (UPF0748 family)
MRQAVSRLLFWLGLSLAPLFGEPVEVRACYLTHVDSQVMDSRENLAEAMSFLKRHGFNTVYVVVWARGLTLYPSPRLQEETGQRQDPRFAGRDPLAEAVELGHQNGLAVVAWFEYGFAESYGEKGSLLGQRHPEWLCLGQDGKPVTKNGFRWFHGLDPEVQYFLLGLMQEVLSEYAVDGIQGDDRWPAMPSSGGYHEWVLDQFGSNCQPQPHDPDWLVFRAQRLSEHLQDARAMVTGRWLISAPSIQGWAYREYLQDWVNWLQQDLVDWVHPQAYRRSLAEYQACLRPLLAQLTSAQLQRVAPALLIQSGSYRVQPSLLVEMIEWNRKCGFGGEALFFYEGLRADGDKLARALSEGPYRQPAQLPRSRR